MITAKLLLLIILNAQYQILFKLYFILLFHTVYFQLIVPPIKEKVSTSLSHFPVLQCVLFLPVSNQFTAGDDLLRQLGS